MHVCCQVCIYVHIHQRKEVQEDPGKRLFLPGAISTNCKLDSTRSGVVVKLGEGTTKFQASCI